MLATQCPPECDTNTIGGLVQHYLTHPETFKPEFVNAYEIGTKNTFLDGQLTANLSAFYYDYTVYQISEIVDRSALNFNFDAKVWGAELEMDWRPLENLRLGFKGGYENTRVAHGMKAIDLMDRTAGKPGWMVYRPFPTLPSNCVVPTSLAIVGYINNHQIPIPSAVCSAYSLNLDPVTYLPYVPDPTLMRCGFRDACLISEWQPELVGYHGYDPASANNGQGFEKDLSGHQLPNAPKFTAPVTADYTVPLPNDWLMTLHTDLYRQSEAWTRIFNDPGYDKLKAYNNVNLAAIFSNEDRGWQVMAYVKNVFDKNNITGAFLNSDDTGLTTNVFLNEPRLYGIRVTKSWSGGSGWVAGAHKAGEPYLLTVEAGARMLRMDTPNQAIMPFQASFPRAIDPLRHQTENLDWTSSPELRVTYRPSGSAWTLSASARYGRTEIQTGRLRQELVTGDAVCAWPTKPPYDPAFPGVDLSFIGKLRCDPSYGPVTKNLFGQQHTFQNKYNPQNLLRPTDRASSSTNRAENHKVVDFVVGKDVGLGGLGISRSSLNLDLRYAEFKSTTSGDMRTVPDLVPPDDFWVKYPTTFHQYAETFDAKREFKGAGPTISWDASRLLMGSMDASHLDVDWSLAAGVLFGKQQTKIAATQGSSYFDGKYPFWPQQYVLNGLAAPIQTPMNIAPRNTSVSVPVVDLSLGLSYETPGVKLSTGYRWERYFNVLDGGFTQHGSYDRTLDGPYFKVSVGFGG